jgi:hypothetical protein
MALFFKKIHGSACNFVAISTSIFTAGDIPHHKCFYFGICHPLLPLLLGPVRISLYLLMRHVHGGHVSLEMLGSSAGRSRSNSQIGASSRILQGFIASTLHEVDIYQKQCFKFTLRCRSCAYCM